LVELDWLSVICYLPGAEKERMTWRKKMQNHLPEFIENLRRAPGSEADEKIVRRMIEVLATHCPMHVLVQLGQCVIDWRKSEIRNESERN
jgi:hypothetical protein